MRPVKDEHRGNKKFNLHGFWSNKGLSNQRRCTLVQYINAVLCLKQYSEISGRLKHPFSLTPIDRYSLGKLMFKISVGYDFTLARYAE